MSQQAPERPTGRTALEVAVAARSVQLAIRAHLLRDVTRLWPALDKNRLQETWPGWSRAMGLLVRNYHAQSSTAASSAYRAARELETGTATPRSLVKLAPEPSPEWLDKAFGYSGPGMLSRDTVKPNTALSTTLGTASRIALDGGRTTTVEAIKADPIALGYSRVTDGDPCAFCALMASRGMVYKDAGTAGKDANSKFTGDGLFKFHNDCGCTIAPGFKRGEAVTGIAAEAAEIYKNRGKGDNLNAFRRDWEARNRNPEARRSSKPAASNRKGAPQPVDTTRDVDASRTTADLQATLATLEASLAKFDSPGTRKRVEELRRKIAARG